MHWVDEESESESSSQSDYDAFLGWSKKDWAIHDS